MPIAVIGAGAIGSALAAALSRAGRDVVLVTRGARLAELQSGGLRAEFQGTIEEHSVRAVRYDALPEVEIAICCVKTYDLESAFIGLHGAISPGCIVLSLQDGVEAHEVAARLLPNAAIAAGRMHGFFEMDGDLVRHVGVPPSIMIGCTQGKVPETEAALLDVFAGSIIPAQASPDIRQALWRKFLLAASLGSVACALGIPAGQTLVHPDGGPLLRAAMEEIVRLARHIGISLTDDDISMTLAFIGTFPPEVTTSLQRDLEAGGPSEYHALTATVARIARRHGFDVSTFPHIERMIAAR